MTKPDILQMGPYPSWDVEALSADFTLHPHHEAEDKAAFVKERAERIRGIAAKGEAGADAALIEALPNLEIIAVYGVGYDAVDVEAAKKRGVRVTNTPDVLTDDVADLGVAMLLAHARGVVGADAWVRSGNWAKEGAYPLQRRAFGARVGILGLGRIGRAVAERLAAFKMEIAYCTRSRRETPESWAYMADPAELAAWADFMVVAVPGGGHTAGLVDARVIEALGPKGVLVNIARASVVDEAVLLDALEAGRIGGAALDVFEGEPNLNPRFTKLDNVLLQPHQASATGATRKAMGDLVRQNLLAHFAGRDLPTPVA